MSHHAKVYLIDFEADKIAPCHRANYISTKLSPDAITSNIITFATSTKTNTNKVSVWDITKRNGNLLLKVLCKSAEIPFIDNNNITKAKLNNSNMHQNTAGTNNLVNSIYKALCDRQDYACRGDEFTSDQVNNAFKKRFSFFLHSENIDWSSNELFISINQVCSIAFPELKNIRLENAKKHFC